jgi:hypothetical protein
MSKRSIAAPDAARAFDIELLVHPLVQDEA